MYDNMMISSTQIPVSVKAMLCLHFVTKASIMIFVNMLSNINIIIVNIEISISRMYASELLYISRKVTSNHRF